ncbi:MAG TPA: protein kinase [Anaerolineae bacterium]|nr:protein kinase [Anaerolineae bacterium]
MALTTGQTLQTRYRIVAPLGQGGMGAVYRAWDTRLQVPVALKEMMPQAGIAAELLAQLRQQFEQEAMVLARLSHPHLVRVTDFFEEQSNVYLVMDFVEGENLADHIAREGALPEAAVLAWANALLDALEYCHRQRIIHRDIKPQNVILRPDGQAVLVDFGLVKLWDPQDPRTRTAMRGMGSPEYAPPEQYSLRGQHTDPRTDLYGLGATLYHALTGQAPLSATDRMAMPDDFLMPTQIAPAVSPYVETAILRAMALRLDERWASAAEMKAALQGKKAASKPTTLLPESAPATTGDEVSRLYQTLQHHIAQGHWEEAERTAQAITLLSPGYKDVAALLQQAQDNRAGRQEAEALWQQLNQALSEEEKQHQAALAALDQEVQTQTQTHGKLTSQQKDLQKQRAELQKQLATVEKTLKGVEAQLAQLQSDQSRIPARQAQLQQTAERLGKRHVALAEAQRYLTERKYREAQQALYRIGKIVRGGLTETDLPQLSELYCLEHTRRGIFRVSELVSAVAFVPHVTQTSQLKLAAATEKGSIWLWEIPSKKYVTLTGHEALINAIAFSPDGEMLASGSEDGTVRVWRMDDLKDMYPPLQFTAQVNDVAFSPDGTVLTVGSSDSTVGLWQVSDGKLLRKIKSQADSIASIAFAPSGDLLALGTFDDVILIVQTSDGKRIKTLKGHKSWISGLAFSPDGLLLASTAMDNTARLWDVADGSTHAILKGHQKEACGITFTPDGLIVVSGSYDRTLKFWRVKDGALLHTLTGHTDAIFGVAFSPDGRMLASASGDGTVRVWGLPTKPSA